MTEIAYSGEGTCGTGHPRRIRALDGLRAIAILMVLVDHYVPRVLIAHGPVSSLAIEASEWAGTGVDLFFVLSGFLITGILLDAKGTPDYFRRFYWRRSLRIFPAFYALLLFAIVVMPFLFRRVGFGWFALYLRNWIGADRASDGTLGHLWSLAVEEQFYIGWSVVVFLCPRRYITGAILILAATAPLVRLSMHDLGYAGYLIFRVTPARMDSLLLGALVTVAARSGGAFSGRMAGIAGMATGLTGLSLLRLFAGTLNIDAASYQIAFPSLIAISFASLVLWSLHLKEGSAAHAVLTCRPFRVVAQYSYAIYLWHLVAALAAVAILQPAGSRPVSIGHYPLAFLPLACGISFAMAWVSWRVIERPAMNLKDRFFSAAEGDRESLVAATANSRLY